MLERAETSLAVGYGTWFLNSGAPTAYSLFPVDCGLCQHSWALLCQHLFIIILHVFSADACKPLHS